MAQESLGNQSGNMLHIHHYLTSPIDTPNLSFLLWKLITKGMLTSYEGDLALSERDLLLQHVEFSNASGRRVVLPSAEFAVPFMENSREISKIFRFCREDSRWSRPRQSHSVPEETIFSFPPLQFKFVRVMEHHLLMPW
jgi:hypothetical protein